MRFERLTMLWTTLPSQDRAWRRRDLLVLCRAHPDLIRLGIDSSPERTAAFGGRGLEKLLSSRFGTAGKVEKDQEAGWWWNGRRFW